MNLSKRQNLILKAVIEEYTRTALPVSSASLKEMFNFLESSATLRSELSYLESLGLLSHPHTSAGRIPTVEGYRYFVDSLMENRSLTTKEQKTLEAKLFKAQKSCFQLSRLIAQILADLSKNLAFSADFEENEVYDIGLKNLLKEPEFSKSDEMAQIIYSLEYLKENFEKLKKNLEMETPQIFIGKENPIVKTNNTSFIISTCRGWDNKKAVIAIIGPTRMHYAKNLSLLKYLNEFLKSHLLILLFISLPLTSL
jgi:heat-inducible transcriptional repressor